MARTSGPGWLLLIHQIPPRPAYLRAKIGRRLQQVGAVAVKNSVYVLPLNASPHEDFPWIAREIVKGGGEATICEARFVEGLSDEGLRRLFNGARDADYADVGDAAREASGLKDADREAELSRLRQRLADLEAIDFFGARGRSAAVAAVERLRARIDGKTVPEPRPGLLPTSRYRGRTWVTRRGIHIDRIGSAWLIRRFIDPKARFKFVPGKTYEPRSGELRFDMFEGEFTHEGEDCSFETLLRRFGLHDPGLRALAEIIHDIDLKDRKFRRDEAPGIDRLISGICMARKEDADRLAEGSLVFRSLYEYFRRKLA